jgi:outer membrane protein OmpA-like peptidoglycan-associated protein
MFVQCCHRLIRYLIIAGVFIFLFYSVSHALDIAQLPTTKSTGIIATLQGTEYMLCENCPDPTVFKDVPPPAQKPPTPSIAIRFSNEPLQITKAEPSQQPEQVHTGKPAAEVTEDQPVTVHFDFNSSNVKGGEREKIKGALSSLKSAAALKVTGYTDDLGSRAVNDELALRRAQAVASYLRELGIKGEDLSVEGRGKCCYTDPRRRSLNRRAEITNQ